MVASHQPVSLGSTAEPANSKTSPFLGTRLTYKFPPPRKRHSRLRPGSLKSGSEAPAPLLAARPSPVCVWFLPATLCLLPGRHLPVNLCRLPGRQPPAILCRLEEGFPVGGSASRWALVFATDLKISAFVFAAGLLKDSAFVFSASFQWVPAQAAPAGFQWVPALIFAASFQWVQVFVFATGLLRISAFVPAGILPKASALIFATGFSGSQPTLPCRRPPEGPRLSRWSPEGLSHRLRCWSSECLSFSSSLPVS